MGRNIGARMPRARVVLRAIFLALVAALAPIPARAEVAAEDARARALELTQSAAALAVEHGAADAATQSRITAQLRSVLEERRAFLADLVQTAPGDVLAARLPERFTASLPQDLRALVERRGQAEGDLTVAYVDFEDESKSHIRYELKTDAGERIALHFANRPTQLLTGERVIARGLILDADDGAAMALESGEDDLEVAYCCTGGGSGGGATPELPNTLGEQRTAVLLVNFADDLSQPWTVAQAQDVVFGETADYYLEASHGQSWLTGNVFGWLTIAETAANVACGPSALGVYVADAAAAAGINLSSYDRLVYVTPETSCGFDGSATVGGAPSEAWINGKFTLQVVAHEIGHNFGLLHSHSLDCGDVSLGENCTHKEYGDTIDAMGGASSGHFSSFQKARLGWIAESGGSSVEAALASGSYTIEPFETAPGVAPKAIKVDAGSDPVSGAQRWLYLEYRQPLGFDSFLAEFSNNGVCREVVTDGVYVHLATDGDPDSSYLLHMKAGGCFSQTFGVLDWNDPALAVGDSYTVPNTGVVISVDSVSASGAAVTIGGGGAPVCTAAAPVVSVAPVGDNWGAPGDTVAYDVTVTNADSAACGVSSIDLSAAAPAGWTAAFADTALTLDAGQTGATTLSLTSAAGVVDGAYDTDVTAMNGPDAGADIATYIVQSPAENQPPVAADDSATTTSSASVTIPVLDNDFDPEGDPLTVAVVGNPGKGSVILNADGAITYTPGAKAKGSDSFGYTITDGVNTASATVSISFSKGGDTSGGGSGGGGGGKGGGKGKP